MQARSWPKTFGFLLLVATRPATGDIVKLTNKPVFRNVTITDFRGDKLIFRGVSEQYLRKPLDQVEYLAIDGEPELNAAEQAATAGNWAAAAARYDEALAMAQKPWLRALIRLRLLATCEHAGRFDRAVSLYIELLEASPALAAAHAPRAPGGVGSDMNRRARATLEGALAKDPMRAISDPVRTLLLELLIYEEVAPLPPHLTGVTAPTPPPTRQPPDRARHLGILPGSDDEPDLVAASRPGSSSQPSGLAGPPRLTGDSFVLRAAETACEAGDFRRASRLVERSLPYVGVADRVPWRLLLGRCRIELGQPAEAAADLLNLSETVPDRSRAALALYYVALAHERLDRADVARSLYEELLQRADAPETVKTNARAALQRLTP
jgi:tetratricopeptide (TPR) repeat protein